MIAERHAVEACLRDNADRLHRAVRLCASVERKNDCWVFWLTCTVPRLSFRPDWTKRADPVHGIAVDGRLLAHDVPAGQFVDEVRLAMDFAAHKVRNHLKRYMREFKRRWRLP